jgi:hypothetical protein
MSEEKRKEMLDKARERGYSVVMHSSDKNWYSFTHELYRFNLQITVSTGEFKFTFMRGIIEVTTGNCGSFMNDEHFRRIEREMRSVVFDLL